MKKSGISLVALVVTIIVLIILTGAISLTTENSIINNAKNAIDRYNAKVAIEHIVLAVSNSYDEQGNLDIENVNTELAKEGKVKYKGDKISETNKIASLPAIITINEVEYIITQTGKVETNISEVTTQEELINKLAQGARTIKILNDITITQTIQIDGNVNIIGNNNIIQRDSSNEGCIFKILPNSEVVISNLVFDGGAPNWRFDDTYVEQKTPTCVEETGLIVPDTDIISKKSFIYSQGNLIVNNCIFKNAVVDQVETNPNLLPSGEYVVQGAITCVGTSEKNIKLEFNNSIIRHCAAIRMSDGGAGAAFDTLYTDVEINGNSIIEDNYGYGNGAIIAVSKNGIIEINGAKINNNLGHGNGIIMVLDSSEMILNSGEIKNNVCMATSTGGISPIMYFHRTGSFTMNGGIISDNTVRRAAIVKTSTASTINILGGTILNNTSKIYNEDVAFEMRSCTLNIGNNMTIGGNIKLTSNTGVINLGVINGNIDIKDNDYTQTGMNIENYGTINGNVTIKNSTWKNEGIVNGQIIQ